jgi:hypothetical protein
MTTGAMPSVTTCPQCGRTIRTRRMMVNGELRREIIVRHGPHGRKCKGSGFRVYP